MAELRVVEPAEPGRALIAARGLGVEAGGRWLVRGVDLEVAAGEIVTLIGPNGGGKTTVLRALLGLLAPGEGRVERPAGLTIGYLPQRLRIDPVLPLTVARLMTATRRHPRGAVGEALASTGVAPLANRQVQDLSGGELQRVLLARALLSEPDLLVLDEPVQGVDHAGEAELYRLIDQIRRTRDVGILLVSHDLHVVMAATDRVICLNHHVCCTGAPEEVTRHSEYRRLFGPRALPDPVEGAVALYRHDHDHEHDLHGEVVEPGAGGRCSGR